MYVNVDAYGIDLSPLAPNDTFSSPLYNFAAPWPPDSPMAALATCRHGPCINTCCTGDAVTGACTDNLAINGGHYQLSAHTAYKMLCSAVWSFMITSCAGHRHPQLFNCQKELLQEGDMARCSIVLTFNIELSGTAW